MKLSCEKSRRLFTVDLVSRVSVSHTASVSDCCTPPAIQNLHLCFQLTAQHAQPSHQHPTAVATSGRAGLAVLHCTRARAARAAPSRDAVLSGLVDAGPEPQGRPQVSPTAAGQRDAGASTRAPRRARQRPSARPALARPRPPPAPIAEARAAPNRPGAGCSGSRRPVACQRRGRAWPTRRPNRRPPEVTPRPGCCRARPVPPTRLPVCGPVRVLVVMQAGLKSQRRNNPRSALLEFCA